MIIMEFSKSVLDALRAKIAKGDIAYSSELGDMFTLEDLPVSGIKLKVPLGKYLEFIESLPAADQPRSDLVVPYEDQDFQVIINAPVVKKGSELYINGKEVILL